MKKFEYVSVFSIIFGVLIGILWAPGIFAQESSVPDWIKNTAGFWASDEISDTEFVNAISFLIGEKIIQVPGFVPVAQAGMSATPDVYYTIQVTEISSEYSIMAKAFCDMGDIATGGGMMIDQYNLSTPAISLSNGPVLDNEQISDGWQTFVVNPDEKMQEVSVYVICKDFEPLR